MAQRGRRGSQSKTSRSLPCAQNPDIGFVFSKLPNGPRLGPSNGRLGLFLQNRRRPQDWVRCAAAGTIQPLGSYFQTCPRAHAFRPSNRRLGLFLQPQATARLGSLRSAANQPLGSYFQTCPRAFALGARIGGLGLFLQAVGGTPRFGSLRSSGHNPAVGFVFSNLPKGPRLGTRTGGWVCFYKLSAVLQDLVRCAARQTSHWVRIFKFAQRPPPRVLQRAVGVPFLRDVNRPSEVASLRM